MAKPSVAIMGGSLGGLTAGLYLREAGCDVAIYERSRTPLIGQGAGIVLNPATVRYFCQHQVVDLDAISVAAQTARYMDRNGDIAAEDKATYRFSSYNALYRGLLDCFGLEAYHLDCGVVDFHQDGNSVTIQLANGQQVQSDLLVCADGIRSTARKLLLPEVSLRYAGYMAWRGIVGANELSLAIFALHRAAVTYHLLPNSHVLAYPIPVMDRASDPTQPLINWLWYRNVPQGAILDDLLTDKEGARREASVPPGAVQRQHIRALQHDANTVLPPALAELITQTAQPFLQVIVDCAVPRMAFGRICLIGDAAFVARPHAAAGTAKAAEDGWKLGEAIKAANGDVVAALQQWEPSQLKLGQAVLDRARRAGERVQFENAWQVGEPLPLGLYAVGDSANVF